MTWELLWQASLISTLIIFAVMSVLVTICGARDIRRLLRDLRDAESDSAQQEEPS